MFVKGNITKKDHAYTYYRLDINIMRPCHRKITVTNLEHYII